MKQIFKILGSLVLLLLHTPSFANDDEKKQEGDPYVKLSTISIPITDNRRVTNYIFLSIRINLSPKANMIKLREKEPYFRDALMRSAYQISFGQKGHDDRLDEPRFKATMLPVFSQITGKGMITSIEILDQKPKISRSPH